MVPGNNSLRAYPACMTTNRLLRGNLKLQLQEENTRFQHFSFYYRGLGMQRKNTRLCLTILWMCQSRYSLWAYLTCIANTSGENVPMLTQRRRGETRLYCFIAVLKRYWTQQSSLKKHTTTKQQNLVTSQQNVLKSLYLMKGKTDRFRKKKKKKLFSFCYLSKAMRSGASQFFLAATSKMAIRTTWDSTLKKLLQTHRILRSKTFNRAQFMMLSFSEVNKYRKT